MADLLLRSRPIVLAPAPIGVFRRSRVALRRRGGGGSGVLGLRRKRSVGASELDLVYSSESSDGSVVFRFGSASEIAEYMGLKEAESEGVGKVEDGTLEENVVSGGKEETVEGFADEIADTKLCVDDVEKYGEKMQEDEIDCTSGSAENLSGVRISSNYVGVSDSIGIVLNIPVEELSVREETDESLRKVDVAENSRSYEITVESGCETELNTFKKTGGSDGDLKRNLGKENVSVESSSMLDDNSECNLENDNVNIENARSSADDF